MDRYRPNHERYRDARDRNYQASSYQDPDNYYRNRDYHDYPRSRSRSPPRRLDYDDEGYAADAYDGRAQVVRASTDVNRSDVLKYIQNRGRAPPAKERPQERPAESFSRHDGPREMMPYEEYPPVPPPNHGEKDEGDSYKGWNFVLVRNLKESATEEIFAKGMEKLYRGNDEQEGGATPQSIKRVLLIRDRETDQSMGFGFVEYHVAGDAYEAVQKARAEETRGKLFTIASRHVSVSYPHVGVFPPDAVWVRPEWNEKFTFAIEGKTGRHRYHDRRYYASIFVVNEQSPHADPGLFRELTDAEKATSAPTKGKRTETLETKTKKRKPLGAVVPALLSQWNTKQAELRGEQDAAVARVEPKQPATGVNAIVPVTSTNSTSPPTLYEQTSAHEGEVIACYLCASQFKSKDGIIKHLKESEMHAKYLQDESLKKRALERMQKKDIDPGTTVKLPPPAERMDLDHDASKPQYRDRAKERRKEEAQTVGQKVGFSLTGLGGKKSAGGRAAGSPSSSDTEKGNAVQLSSGIGANIMKKKGYVEGQGLGSGGGVTAPIEQNMYAAGVGLGHESSKRGDAVEEAERMTKGGGYQEMGRELQHSRYYNLK
ncbi:hypothetical protein LTR37_018892 [Vermiconidia calcicola]|uniref:Uncharacterized protein n=1 Tax=Vermiconidia calcicola TaxID=1690605 RepID=A0ACC3MFY4_9PEZI|nr:hypothetical protein LTR37_018892 [Vermiconidia calcicola]